MKLYVDTREQLPLEFEVDGVVTEVIRTKLPYGDYAAGWEDKKGNHIEFMPLFWERKGLGDLFGTLTSGMERFKREIERAKEDGISLIIIIEGCRREVELGYEHSSVSGHTILNTLDTLHVKHGIEHVFCNDRKDMVKTIISKFKAIGRNFKPLRREHHEATTGAEETSSRNISERKDLVEQSKLSGLREPSEVELER